MLQILPVAAEADAVDPFELTEHLVEGAVLQHQDNDVLDALTSQAPTAPSGAGAVCLGADARLDRAAQGQVEQLGRPAALRPKPRPRRIRRQVLGRMLAVGLPLAQPPRSPMREEPAELHEVFLREPLVAGHDQRVLVVVLGGVRRVVRRAGNHHAVGGVPVYQKDLVVDDGVESLALQLAQQGAFIGLVVERSVARHDAGIRGVRLAVDQPVAALVVA